MINVDTLKVGDVVRRKEPYLYSSEGVGDIFVAKEDTYGDLMLYRISDGKSRGTSNPENWELLVPHNEDNAEESEGEEESSLLRAITGDTTEAVNQITLLSRALKDLVGAHKEAPASLRTEIGFAVDGVSSAISDLANRIGVEYE